MTLKTSRDTSAPSDKIKRLWLPLHIYCIDSRSAMGATFSYSFVQYRLYETVNKLPKDMLGMVLNIALKYKWKTQCLFATQNLDFYIQLYNSNTITLFILCISINVSKI